MSVSFSDAHQLNLAYQISKHLDAKQIDGEFFHLFKLRDKCKFKEEAQDSCRRAVRELVNKLLIQDQILLMHGVVSTEELELCIGGDIVFDYGKVVTYLKSRTLYNERILNVEELRAKELEQERAELFYKYVVGVEKKAVLAFSDGLFDRSKLHLIDAIRKKAVWQERNAPLKLDGISLCSVLNKNLSMEHLMMPNKVMVIL